MAKRRRLDISSLGPLETKSSHPLTPPPIAEVAGEAAALSAAGDVVAEMEAARAGGRLVVEIPLTDIVSDHLVRDRMGVDHEAMEALIDSIRRHGQRTPIEVLVLAGGQYGLISGWRRLHALRALGIDTVQALIRQPSDAGEAYVAMVEENEIRVGLSYYERAAVAVRAAGAGAFEDVEAAVDALFAAGSKAKRSKIRAFVSIYDQLATHLTYPADLPERLGLRVAQALKAGHGAALIAALAPKPADAASEALALERGMSQSGGGKASGPRVQPLGPGLDLSVVETRGGARITLSGKAVTPELEARLVAFLTQS